MCESGGINCFDLAVPTWDWTDTQVEWFEDIKVLDSKVDTLREDIGALGIRDRTEVDFSAAYERMYQISSSAVRLSYLPIYVRSIPRLRGTAGETGGRGSGTPV
jgi:hypothetical protein